MNSENPIYKTAELVRDAVGCYYFICLQCGKDFENLDDTVDHIEKYFYEPSDDNNADLLTPMTINESDWMANDGDVETVVTNIKKESIEEYEDYKLSIPQMYEEDNEPATNVAIYCPLCSQTLMEISLESHLMRVHHRSRNHAKIYECHICGRNTFTRSYDLERHELIHARCGNATADSTVIAGENVKLKRNGDRNKNSTLFTMLSQSDIEPIAMTLENPHVVQSPSVSSVQHHRTTKRNIHELDVAETSHKKVKSLERVDNDKVDGRPVKGKILDFCSICQTTCSKNETLESHLIRVHRRNKQYAKVYECDICGKNTFTRPYDLRRHELIHLAESRKNREASSSKKVIKTEPKTDDKSIVIPVPSTKPLTIRSDRTSATEVKKSVSQIRTTNPQKNGILCSICDEKFDSYFDVTMHLKFAHNQKRSYKCSHANCKADSFSNAFLLHRHEMSHSAHYRNIVGISQNRMKCVFCHRSFNKKWNLMKHEKRHISEMSHQ